MTPFLCPSPLHSSFLLSFFIKSNSTRKRTLLADLCQSNEYLEDSRRKRKEKRSKVTSISLATPCFLHPQYNGEVISLLHTIQSNTYINTTNFNHTRTRFLQSITNQSSSFGFTFSLNNGSLQIILS